MSQLKSVPRIALILAMASTCPILSASAAENPKLKTPKEYFESIDRTISVHPQTPADGIKSGLVIVFGHPIASPYKIEFLNQKLIVNGIQVDPAPVRQREHGGPPQISSAQISEWDSIGAMTGEARSYYAQNKRKIPEDELKTNLIRLVKQNPNVKDAIWQTDTLLGIKLKSDRYDVYGYGINFPRVVTEQPPVESPEVREKNLRKGQEDHVAGINKKLREGLAVFFTSDGGIHYGLDPRDKVNGIMSDKTLTKETREDKLREEVFPGSFIPALDVIANYKPSEWKREAK